MAKKAFKPYSGRDPREVPTYTAVDAGHYLWLPHRTLQTWVYGYSTGSGESRKKKPAIIPADSETGLLSFADLMELHVLAAIRREHGVTLQRARDAREYLQQAWGRAHPLIDEEMETDGKYLFVKRLGGHLVNASKSGQLAITEVIGERLKRIVRDTSGLATRLHPFTNKAHFERSDAPRLVSIDPRLVFGRPVVTGSRVPTGELAERFWAGDSPSVLRDEYGRSEEEVVEAIRYEWWRAGAAA